MVRKNYLERKKATLIESLKSRINDPEVISVMNKVPRHLFVPTDRIDQAYEDMPLSIGSGQTISQPYIVALMTSALELTGNEKVLEVGTGSGYQAAILAELCKVVITTERIPSMAEKAAKTLASMGYDNIQVKTAGTELGWRESAPYDAILVAAAAPQVPQSLIEQLKPNGRLIIPVGERHQQELLKIIKGSNGVTTTNLSGCRFVSLIGPEAWSEQ